MKHLRTILSLIMALAMAACVFGCAKEEPAPAAEEPAATEEAAAPAESESAAEPSAEVSGENTEGSFLPEGYVPPDILIVSGPSGGNWNAMGASFSEAMNRAGGKASYIVGGGTQNVIAVGDGSATVGFCNQFGLDSAYKGTDPYTRVYDDVVALMALETNMLYLIVPAGSPITCVADLKGKTVAVSSVGSNAYDCAVDALVATGLDPEADLTLRPGSMSEGADMMKDRLVDAFLIMTGTSNSTIMDICTSLDVDILSLEESTQQNMMDANIGYRKLTLPAGSYQGQDEDVYTITSDNSLICDVDMPEEEAYWITKAIVENWDYIKTANGWLSDCTLETLSNTGKVALHPGAARYFEEVMGE